MVSWNSTDEMSQLFTASDPWWGGGGVRKSLRSADTMENWSYALIMHNPDQEKSIRLYDARPEEFPRFTFLLWSHFYTNGSILTLGRVVFIVLFIVICEKVSPLACQSESSWGLSIKRNRYSPAHLQHIYGTAVQRCANAAVPTVWRGGMLHCEQLCFKAASHQGMYSKTSWSILCCDSILLPLQSSFLLSLTAGNAQGYTLTCWHSKHGNIFSLTVMHDRHCCSAVTPVCIVLVIPSESIRHISHPTSSMCWTIFSRGTLSPFSLTGASCSLWLPEWEG